MDMLKPAGFAILIGKRINKGPKVAIFWEKVTKSTYHDE